MAQVSTPIAFPKNLFDTRWKECCYTSLRRNVSASLTQHNSPVSGIFASVFVNCARQFHITYYSKLSSPRPLPYRREVWCPNLSNANEVLQTLYYFAMRRLTFWIKTVRNPGLQKHGVYYLEPCSLF